MTDMVPGSYEQVLEANLVPVFRERNGRRRRAAIPAIDAPDAVLYGPQASASGDEAIDRAVLTETDVAHLSDGRTRSLYVMLDPAGE